MHLKLDLYKLNGEHAVDFMARVGIKYQYATPQSLGDTWLFWNCINLPTEIPTQLSEFHINPKRLIGYGLSADKAKSIIKCSKIIKKKNALLDKTQ